MRYLLIFLIAGSLTGCGKYVSVYFRTVDEDGIPVARANVIAGYHHGYSWTDSGKEYIETGSTNDNGIYHYTAHVAYRDNDIPGEIEDVFASFVKEGYYRSYAQYIKDKDIHIGRWHSVMDPMIIVLRRKLNPVAMYARDTQIPLPLIIPAVGKEIGFDLIEYDWVSPYGNGKNVDFIFKLDKKFVSERDYNCNLTITFPNKYDGIQIYREDRKYGSVFKLPRFAPETGYLQRIILSTAWVPQKGIVETFREENNYFFRIRSEEKDGTLIRAIYGKIQGDIGFEPRGRKTASILFKYYLNPDYTRNMEFGRNIFKGLNIGLD